MGRKYVDARIPNMPFNEAAKLHHMICGNKHYVNNDVILDYNEKRMQIVVFEEAWKSTAVCRLVGHCKLAYDVEWRFDESPD